MNKEGFSVQEVMADYQRHAPRYDTAVHRFDLFARFGFNISSWHATAIASLNLKPGDTVVEIGCGTTFVPARLRVDRRKTLSSKTQWAGIS